MAIPSVEQFSQQPGGGLAYAMRGLNALTQSNLENQIKSVQAQYAPLTTQAQAFSKLAYANLMGPQFMAKLLNNPDIAANLTKDQLNNALKTIYSAGTTGATGTSGSVFMPQGTPQIPISNSNSLSSMLINRFKSLGLSEGGSPSLQSDAQPSPQYQPQPQAQTQPVLSQPNVGQVNQTGITPENNQTIPAEPVIPDSGTNTYFEKAGRAAGIKKEGEELGKQRALAIGDLGKQYVQDSEAMAPLIHLGELTNSPVFAKLKSENPLFLSMQQKALSKIGTPEEQKIIGDFIVSTKTAIANTVNSFHGRAMAKEFDFANMMKVSDNDTLGTMIGKLESLMTFKQATMNRNEIARDLMSAPYHMNEGDAYQQANKSVDMQAIRKNIGKTLNAQQKVNVTDEDINFMAKKYNISRDEVNRRLKAKGII